MADPGALGVVVSSGGLVRVNPGGIAVVVDVEGIEVMVHPGRLELVIGLGGLAGMPVNLEGFA